MSNTDGLPEYIQVLREYGRGTGNHIHIDTLHIDYRLEQVKSVWLTATWTVATKTEGPQLVMPYGMLLDSLYDFPTLMHVMATGRWV